MPASADLRELDERLLTAQEAAEMLGLSVASVYNMMNSGRLTYIMLNDTNRRLRRSALLEIIDQSERRGPRTDFIPVRHRGGREVVTKPKKRLSAGRKK